MKILKSLVELTVFPVTVAPSVFLKTIPLGPLLTLLPFTTTLLLLKPFSDSLT